MISYLIGKNSRNKIKCVIISCDEEWNDGFIIKRETFQYGGKHTQQPDIIVSKAKQNRTFKEQLELEYNSNKKKYLDKGYKQLDKPLDEYNEEELYNILGDICTNQDNIPKPQLAKQSSSVSNIKTFDKLYYGSRKIDGLRVLIYMSDGVLHTASRGATNYDNAMSEILNHPDLIKLFKENPGLIMDGECYKHHYSLQKINSIARTQVTITDYSILQFYWYDIVDINMPTYNRIEKINELAKQLNLTFDPDRKFNEGELRIQVVPHVEISGWDNIIQLHNEYVSEGWEGLVIRLKDSLYSPNKRSNDWIKVKEYKDSEFIVKGYELGLRGSEDMVFILETEEGLTFKAKPCGDRELKQWYIDNFETECLDKYATVKYFYLSDEGVPLQPTLKAFREDKF